MTRHSYAKYKEDYQTLIDTMVIKPEWRQAINKNVRLIKSNRKRYEEIQTLTGVPWYFIGLLHLRESSCNFEGHLHNGDPLHARTKKVPRGRPKDSTPPFTFEESAVDAIKLKGLDKVTDWSVSHMTYLLECYNGFGYHTLRKPHPSPYLWSGTNHYVKGKYVSDGKYKRDFVDQQLGVMPVLMGLMHKAEYDHAKKEVEKHSTKVRTGDYLKWVTGLITSVGLAWNQIWQWAEDNVLYVAAALVIGFIVYIQYNKHKTINDYREGRYKPSRAKAKEGRH